MDVPKVFGDIPKPNPPKKWASLFPENRGKNKGLQLEYVEPTNDQVLIDEEDHQPLHNNWKFCLVGCFTGRFPGMQAVQNLTKSWGVKCTIVPYARGWIIFRFDCNEDRIEVLTKGPYKVFGKMIMLKTLSEKFRYDKDEFLDVPVWIKFHGVPLDLWNKKALSKISSRLGKPIETDQVTHEQQRLSYARVLVEVNLRKEPVKEFPIFSATTNEVIYIQKIEYENFPDYCYYCSKFSHGFEQCKRHEELAKVEVTDDKAEKDQQCVKGQPSNIVMEPSKDPVMMANKIAEGTLKESATRPNNTTTNGQDTKKANHKSTTKGTQPKVGTSKVQNPAESSKKTTPTVTQVVPPKEDPPKTKDVQVPVNNAFEVLSEEESSGEESESSDEEPQLGVVLMNMVIPEQEAAREKILETMMARQMERWPTSAALGVENFEELLKDAIEDEDNSDHTSENLARSKLWMPIQVEAYRKRYG